MDVAEAISVVQQAAEAGRLMLTKYARDEKLPLLGLFAADVDHVVESLTADESHEQDDGTWKLYGFTAEGAHMAIVVDLDAGRAVVVVTIHPYP